MKDCFRGSKCNFDTSGRLTSAARGGGSNSESASNFKLWVVIVGDCKIKLIESLKILRDPDGFETYTI